MVRQARSEATRRRIIDSAVALINEIGYPASGLADIIERAELTKGALYYHFESREAVATAIIEEGMDTILGAFRSAGRSGSPAMENLVHGWFVVADAIMGDHVAQAACRLLRTFGGFNPAAKATYGVFEAEFAERVRSAVEQGDVRSDIDADAVVATVLSSMLGTELVSSALTDGRDLRRRFASTLEILLPAIVAEDAFGYYREFLARQSMRISPSSP
ncbi:MAG: transcriptional regulator [Mycobacterium sp.]|nr:transcriptional regulator [Mycobacterium sp.]